MTGDDHPDHLEDFSDADAWFDAERKEFWRRIHRMSSATYKPTRQIPSVWQHVRFNWDKRLQHPKGTPGPLSSEREKA